MSAPPKKFMAIAIAFGTGYFALVGSFLDSRVPIDGGDRVVMISNRYVPGPDAAGTGRMDAVGPAAFDFRQCIGIEAPGMQLGLRSLQFGAALLLLIVAVNVAILVYAQIGGGVAAGLTVAGILEWVTPGGNVGGKGLILFPTVAAVMFAVGLLAAAGPARRGLAIEPTEALRTE